LALAFSIKESWNGTFTLFASPFAGGRAFAYVTFPRPRSLARLALKIDVLAGRSAMIARFSIAGGEIKVFKIALAVAGFRIVYILDRIRTDVQRFGLEVRRL